jgi:hypothetical protein
MAFRVNQDPARFTGGGLRTGVAPESGFHLRPGGVTPTVRWTYNVNPSVLLETLVSYFDSGIDQLPTTDPSPCVVDEAGRCNPFAEDNYTIDVRQGTVDGPFPVTSRDSRTRATLKSDLSLFLETGHGSHNVKTGFEAARSPSPTTDHSPDPFDDSGEAACGLGGSSWGVDQLQDSVPASFPGTVISPRTRRRDRARGPGSTSALTADKDNWSTWDSFKPSQT